MGKIENAVEAIKKFFHQSHRIFIVSKKPDWKEYNAMAKVTGLGIIVVGVIGFIVTLIFTLVSITGIIL